MSTAPKITHEEWLAAVSALPANHDHRPSDIANKALATKYSLAEQQESEYITAAQARELGAGNAEYQYTYGDWKVCTDTCTCAVWRGTSEIKYRAIKQAQPEQVDEQLYCMVSKEGAPAIRMLRTEVQELHRTLGNTVYWGILDPPDCYADSLTTFNSGCIYTYRTKATIRLDGKMVTPEQAAAEWAARKETHDIYSISTIETTLENYPRFSLTFDSGEGYWYETRPKQPTWTGSREDVLALLKERELIK
jgi:hypothetical protein